MYMPLLTWVIHEIYNGFPQESVIISENCGVVNMLVIEPAQQIKKGEKMEQNFKSHLAITPLEHKNKHHGCFRQELCMSLNFVDSDERTPFGRRDSEEKKVKNASQALSRTKYSHMEWKEGR